MYKEIYNLAKLTQEEIKYLNSHRIIKETASLS